jgi:hypothetical protein
MHKKFFADALANVSRPYPHVLELRSFAMKDQGIKAHNLAVVLRDVNLIVVNEIGRDGEFSFPMLNPMLGIAPIPLCIVGNLGECAGL